ncbi:MAG: hypothetical protein ACRBCL_12615 [Maritimibacter sp.]
MELIGPAPLGSQMAIAAQTPARKPVDVPQVEASQGSGNAGLDAHAQPDQEQNAATARELVKLRAEASNGDRPAGPTPAFQVSILEVQNDLKQAIARMETARSQTRDAQAVSDKAAEAAQAAKASQDAAQEDVEAVKDAEATKQPPSSPTSQTGQTTTSIANGMAEPATQSAAIANLGAQNADLSHTSE